MADLAPLSSILTMMETTSTAAPGRTRTSKLGSSVPGSAEITPAATTGRGRGAGSLVG